jgi:hypothetical protein
VRIRGGDKWTSRVFMSAFSSSDCNSKNFDFDPAPGQSKVCEVANVQETGTIAAPSGCHQSTKGCPTVDLAKIPLGSPGTSALRIADTGEMPVRVDDTGSFRTLCDYSHMAFDDPIVFPGQPGRSHLHTFFGNTATNAHSTQKSIATSGNSTCDGGVANRTAYWVPSLLDTRTGQPLVPYQSIWYYKSGYQGIAAKDIRPMPSGLRMIAGDAKTATVQSTRVVHWSCMGKSGPFTTIANCAAGDYQEMIVTFPQCWDGRNLDSPDHKSHMSYGVDGKGCPSTHPVPLPEIALHVRYLVRATNDPLYWRLSSDSLTMQPGTSGHADWFDGWMPAVRDAWVANCDQKMLDCHANLLGDGRALY